MAMSACAVLQPAPPVAESNPKRDAILVAAERLFLDRGYAGTSMDAIAEAAPVSKPTLYNHFRDKDALFAAVVLQWCQQFLADVKGVLDHAQTAEDALRAMAAKFLDMIHDERALSVHRIVVSEWRQFPDLCTQFYSCGPSSSMGLLADYLRRQHDAGTMNVPHPECAAGLFFSMLKGDLHTQCLLGLRGPLSQADKDGVVDFVVPFFLRGLAADATRA